MTPSNSTPRRTTSKPLAARNAASRAVNPARVPGGAYGGRFHTAFTPCRISTRPFASRMNGDVTRSGAVLGAVRPAPIDVAAERTATSTRRSARFRITAGELSRLPFPAKRGHRPTDGLRPYRPSGAGQLLLHAPVHGATNVRAFRSTVRWSRGSSQPSRTSWLAQRRTLAKYAACVAYRDLIFAAPHAA